MTAEEAAEIVRMALWEAGYPEAVVEPVPARCGVGMGIAVRRVSCVPRHLIHRAFALLFHARRLPYPEFDEWRLWHDQPAPLPVPWWYAAFDEPAVAR